MARVLVIDECSEFREWATCQLLRSGFSVIEARDGLAGLQRAVEDAPDWVLIDAGLSIQSGEEICRRFAESNDSTRDLPIMIWSSHSNEEQKSVALAAGADDFLTRSRRTTNLGERGWTLLGSRLPIGLFAAASDRAEDFEYSTDSFRLGQWSWASLDSDALCRALRPAPIGVPTDGGSVSEHSISTRHDRDSLRESDGPRGSAH